MATLFSLPKMAKIEHPSLIMINNLASKKDSRKAKPGKI
jgi:hypothetical protein